MSFAGKWMELEIIIIYDRMKQAKVIFNYPNFKIPVVSCDPPFFFFFFPPLVCARVLTLECLHPSET
jgi:hypothetical protein